MDLHLHRIQAVGLPDTQMTALPMWIGRRHPSGKIQLPPDRHPTVVVGGIKLLPAPPQVLDRLAGKDTD